MERCGPREWQLFGLEESLKVLPLVICVDVDNIDEISETLVFIYFSTARVVSALDMLPFLGPHGCYKSQKCPPT